MKKIFSLLLLLCNYLLINTELILLSYIWHYLFILCYRRKTKIYLPAFRE
jgi:hypothetical protein